MSLSSVSDVINERQREASLHSSGVVDEIILHAILGEEGMPQFVYANPKCEEWYGFDGDRLTRSPHVFLEHVHGADRLSLQESMTTARTLGTSWEWEGRLVHPKGGHRWVRVAASPQTGQEGRRWHGFFLDVTETGRAAKGNVTLQALSRLLDQGLHTEELQCALAELLAKNNEFPVAIVDWQESGNVVRRAIYGMDGDEQCKTVNLSPDSIASGVLSSGEVYECPDARNGGTSHGMDPFVQMGAGGIVAIPILGKSGACGVLTLLDWHRRKLDASLRVSLETVASLYGQNRHGREEKKGFEESIERFDLALEGTSDGLWDAKLKGVTAWSADMPMYFSQDFGKVLGLKSADMRPVLGTWSRRVHPQDMDRVGRTFWSHLRSRTPFDIEHRIVMPDGATRWFNVRGHGLWGSDGTLLRLAGSLRDITARKEMEAALQRSQKEYRMLVERLPLGLAIVQSGNLAYINTAFLKTLGAKEGVELHRKPMLDLVVDDDREIMAYLVDSERSVNSTSSREVRFRHLEGGDVTLEVAPVKHVRFKGAPALMVTTRDITEQKEMESKLYLADRMSSMGTIAAGMAHEINNPLTFVSGNLDYLLDEVEALEGTRPVVEDSTLREWGAAIQDARRGAQRVGRLVRDLKTFSRVEEERQEATDLKSVLDSTLLMAENHLRHRATLVRLSADIPPVWACSTRLGQVCLNLVLNAIQSFQEDDPAQNRVEVRVERDSEDWALLQIRDNGAGIPAKLLPRIFDPFFTTKPTGLGTGLGLSICHQLVEGMGGTIQVDSVEGKGTCFSVRLPLGAHVRSAASPVHQGNKALKTASSNPARVLVIDDEKSVGETLARGLRGHHVTLTTQGSEALKWIREGAEYDVVFCDVMMPEFNGMDMHARLQQVNPQLAANVVFMTGGAFTTRAQQFLENIENRVIEKPFDIRAVQALVASSTLP